jgi:broad specificity phosphatase PhoE
MRYLEVRRHSARVKPSAHLSREGVDLARRVGATLGPFARVLTSPVTRAVETAVAMGFAIDDDLPELGTDHLPAVGPEVDFTGGYVAWAVAARAGGNMSPYVRDQAALWSRLVAGLRDGEAALVIGHEGIMEGGASGACPTRITPRGGQCARSARASAWPTMAKGSRP